MYRGYLQRVLGRPGEYDRLNENTLRRLLKAREAARQKLTQKGVAEELGVDQRRISRWLCKLKKNNMVYEPEHDPPSEYDGMVEDRLRRLVEQEQGQEEGVADAIDHTHAAFILGLTVDLMRCKLHEFKKSSKISNIPLSNQIDKVRKSLNSSSSSPAGFDSRYMSTRRRHITGIRKCYRRSKSDAADGTRQSPRLGAQPDCEDSSAAAQALNHLEAALMMC
jgi:hypothetical protein